MFMSAPARYLSALPKLLTFAALTVVGIEFFRPGNPHFVPYWIAWLLVSLGLSARAFLHANHELVFPNRAPAVLATGADLDRLTAAQRPCAGRIGWRRGFIFCRTFRCVLFDSDVPHLRIRVSFRALDGNAGSLARASALSSLPTKPRRGLQRRKFRHSCARRCVRSAQSYHDASTEELNGLARDYIPLTDVLLFAERFQCASCRRSRTPSRLLHRSPLHAQRRPAFSSVVFGMRPVLTRGGGAFIVGLRLLQRENYAEAAALLSRLEQGGMLSDEADTIRRAAHFLALFACPLAATMPTSPSTSWIRAATTSPAKWACCATRPPNFPK